jgi:hypothetical protein
MYHPSLQRQRHRTPESEKMSLPFRIGDVVEVDQDKILVDPTLVEFVGERGTVKTMGISWVKILFEKHARSHVFSNDKIKRVEDEDTYRF